MKRFKRKLPQLDAVRAKREEATRKPKAVYPSPEAKQAAEIKEGSR